MTNVVVDDDDDSSLPPPHTASSLLFANAQEKKLYWDRSHYDSPEAQERALARSSTVYLGNLTFSTRSHDVLAMFEPVGRVKDVRLGLQRFDRTPCGFAFVEFKERSAALDAVRCVSGRKLLGRRIRVELDAGFKPGRQYGRGVSGNQVRDDRRGAVDPDRRGGARGRKRSRDDGGGDRRRDGDGAGDAATSGNNDAAADDHEGNPSKNPRFAEDDV